MVPILAKQSIIIKSKNHTSILLGNYECAYAIGLLSKAAGLEENDAYADMAEWHREIAQQLDGFETDDAQMKEVLRMFLAMEPLPAIDEQVKELYHMGYQEKRLWVL